MLSVRRMPAPDGFTSELGGLGATGGTAEREAVLGGSDNEEDAIDCFDIMVWIAPYQAFSCRLMFEGAYTASKVPADFFQATVGWGAEEGTAVVLDDVGRLETEVLFPLEPVPNKVGPPSGLL